MSGRGRRGDLARLLVELPAAPRGALAELLDLEHRPPPPAEDRIGETEAPVAELAPPGFEHSEDPPLYWRVTEVEDFEPPPAEEGSLPVPKEQELLGGGDPCFCLPTPPIAAKAELEGRLRRALAGQRRSQEVHVPGAVRRLSRVQPLEPVPRQSRDAWPTQLHLWLHSHPRLLPIEQDQVQLLGWLVEWLGPEHVIHRVVRDAPSAARRLPPPGAVVLLVSDLGLGGRPSAWVALGEALRSAGCRAVALVPWTPADLPRDLRQAWTLLPWEGGPGPGDRERALEELRMLCAGARLVRPGLLRALRQLLGRRADVGTELQLWRELRCPDRLGFVVGGERRRAWLEGFAKLDVELQASVWELVHAWHAGLPAATRHVHTLGWWHALCEQQPSAPDREATDPPTDEQKRPPAEQAPPPPGDLEAAQEWLRGLRAALEAEAPGMDRVTLERLGVALGAGAAEAVEQDPDAAAAYREATRRRRRSEALGPEHRLLPAGARPRWWALRQEGAKLRFAPAPQPADPYLEALRPGSPLARVPAGPKLSVDGERRWLEGVEEPRVSLEGRRRRVLDTGFQRLRLEAKPPPGWACAMGRDRYGLWADARMGKGEGVVQRFRWIPPGRFRMGSPKEELGRWDDEAAREVRIGRGYWLGDTPVTQALWRAVVGDDPWRFEGAQRPVEGVSWIEVMAFLRRLEPDVHLPTEAEWEHACRAGTTAATWRGELEVETGISDRLDAIAWYSENSAVDRARQAQPVAGRAPNPWGLHDILGNMWEWCVDGWAQQTRDLRPVDPWRRPATATKRLLRGGAWSSDARSCRAAARYALHPSDGWGLAGFRLARGPLPASRRAELEGAEPASAPETP